MLKCIVNEHRYSSLEITLYISYNHIVQKNYFEVRRVAPYTPTRSCVHIGVLKKKKKEQKK